MSLINLLYSSSDYPFFQQYWFQPLIANHFSTVSVEENPSVSPGDTMIITTYQNEHAEWIRPYREQGFKIVVEHLWDSHIFRPTVYDGNQMTLFCKNWIWYNESIWYRTLGYNQYQPQRNQLHAFLLLMHKERPHRDQVLQVLEPLLENSLYSYVSKGITIAGDKEYSMGGGWYNYFNPSWYNSSCFSVVVESYLRSPTEVSEKIFKPLAYYHPFVVYGSAGSLAYLHQQGFETFDNLFDESYDAVEDEKQRFDAVTDQIFTAYNNWLQGDLVIDTKTQDKLQHNHQLFFDYTKVINGIEQEIFAPIKEFFES